MLHPTLVHKTAPCYKEIASIREKFLQKDKLHLELEYPARGSKEGQRW